MNDEFDEQLHTVVGESRVDLISGEWGEELYVRCSETNLGDFVADAYRARLGADIPLANGGGVRSFIAKGDVTSGDLLNVQPFGNELSVVEAMGQNILDALEVGVSSLPEPSGGFLQVSGIAFAVKGEGGSDDDGGSSVGTEGDGESGDADGDGSGGGVGAVDAIENRTDGDSGFARTNDGTAPVIIAIAFVAAIAAVGIVVALVRMRRR